MKTKGRRKIKQKKKVVPYLYLIPSVLGVTIFFLLPFIVVIYYSFINNPVQKEFVGFSNFVSILQNEAFLLALKNTVVFVAISVPLAVVIPLLLALVFEAGVGFKSQLRSALLSPMMVPVVSVVLVLRVLFDSHGVLNEVTALFGFSAIDWLKSDTSLWIMILLFLWKNVGYNMIIFFAGLGSVPKECVEVANIEGASKIQVFFHITIKYLSPSLFFATLLSLINSFKIFQEVYILTGDYPYDTLYLLQHFMNNAFRSLDYQKMSTAAIIISIIMIVVIGILFFVEHLVGKHMEE